MSLIVGFCDVLQHTPLAVTIAPLFEVTSPPHDAVLAVIFDTTFVVTVGTIGFTVTVFAAVAVHP